MQIFVIHEGEQFGPLLAEDAEAQRDAGKFSPTDLAWIDGLDDWKPLGDLLVKPAESEVRDQPPQEQKRTKRMRGIRALVDRCLTAKAVVVATALLLLASWIYPPGFHSRNNSHGWFFLFDMDSTMRVDFGRLFLMNAIMATAGGLFAWTVSRNSTARRAVVRIVFYTLIMVPLTGVVCLGVILVNNIRDDLAHRTTKRFSTATATLFPSDEALNRSHVFLYDALITYFAKKQPWVTVEIPEHGTATFPAGMSSSEIAAVIKKQFFPDEVEQKKVEEEPWKKYADAPSASDNVVGQADLAKIILFDVGSDTFFADTCSGFHGRIRNELLRAIKRIGIRASFYNDAGELIEVRTFWMKDATGAESIVPDAPVSFKQLLYVEHLPVGWKYQLEVTEARYGP